MSASGYRPNFVLVASEVNPRVLAPVAHKLGEQFTLLLDSNDEQETLAMIGAIKATLASVGADFHVLADIIESSEGLAAVVASRRGMR